MQSQTGLMEGVADAPLYANSYRAVHRGEDDEIEMWLNPLRVGDWLPSLVLFLRGDIWVEVPLEDMYLETCEDQRITP